MNKEQYEAILAWSYIEWGGAQIYFLSIIRNSPSNWKFKILLPKSSKPDIINFFAPFGVQFEFIETELGSSTAIGLLQKLKRQWRRITSEYLIYKHLKHQDLESSVLHIEAAPWQSWILLYFLTKKVNVFVTIHNAMAVNPPKWRKNLWSLRLNFLLKQNQFHIFSANLNAIDSLKQYTSKKYWDKLILTRATINPREIEKVLNQNISRETILRNHNLPPNKFIVLCVGQFIDRKGRWVFLEAAKEIIKNNKDILFVWMTPQNPNQEELNKIENFNLGDSFRLILSSNVGMKREDVLNFFRIADIFTLPSLWEGLPISILEAMALGIPTISTDLNAIPEAVKNNETGLLVETNNSRQLAEAILKLYKDEHLRNKLGKQGKEFVISNFDEKNAAEIAILNYEKCLKK